MRSNATGQQPIMGELDLQPGSSLMVAAVGEFWILDQH